jgi:hypothetical protein
MYGWEGVSGVLSPVGDHIPQEFNTLDLTDSKPAKFLDYPKNLEGEETSYR